MLAKLFDHIRAKGYRSDNPVRVTIVRSVNKQRKRLKYEWFIEIREQAESWLKNAMDLGLYTLQRREDVVNFRYADVHTEESGGVVKKYLYVEQEKTENYDDPVRLKIQIAGELATVIERCSNGIDSPFLVHRQPEKRIKSARRGYFTQILPDFLTKAFSAARDKTRLFEGWAKEELPTFHEIRSLGIKLYEDQGMDAQTLAGHANRAMTDHYKRGHEVQWTEVEANLSLNS